MATKLTHKLTIMLFCKGASLKIELTADAQKSWDEAISHASEQCVAQLVGLAKRLAEFRKLRSPDQFNDEGDGFWAIKANCGLRAYGWYHSTRRGVFVISHFIVKKRPRLLQEDKDRMKRNRKRYDPSY
jgi:hypothetical protein